MRHKFYERFPNIIYLFTSEKENTFIITTHVNFNI